MRRTAVLTVWVAALGGCTPLGFWVYADPEFEVSRMRLAADEPADSSLVVALNVWNPNDYDLSTSRLSLELELDGKTVGRFERDSVIPVPPSAAASVSLPFIPARGADRRQITALLEGTHRFRVRGEAVFQTPFGDRKVPVVHDGDMSFGGSVEPASAGEGSETRPGLPMPNRYPAVWRVPVPRPARAPSH